MDCTKRNRKEEEEEEGTLKIDHNVSSESATLAVEACSRVRDRIITVRDMDRGVLAKSRYQI